MKVAANNENKIYLINIIMMILLYMRCISNLFIIPAIIFGIISVLADRKENVYYFLLFLLPYATIFKFSAEQISVFSVLFITFIFRSINKSKLPKSMIQSLIVFCIYAMIVSGLNDLIIILSMICGLIMINEICSNHKYNFALAIHIFAFALIGSSLLAMVRNKLPILNNLISVKQLNTIDGVSSDRFSGLVEDPNYFSAYILIELACLTVLIIKQNNNTIDYLLFTILSFFGLMTVSKMFMIIWAILMIILLLNVIKCGGKKLIIIFSLLIIGSIITVIFIPDIISLYIYRFEGIGHETLNEFSTGRSEITRAYINEIIGNTDILLFGRGFNSVLSIGAPHDTYIQMLYSLGIIGSLILIFTVKKTITLPRISRRDIIVLMPIIILLVLFLGLGTLTSDMLPFIISIILLCIINYGGYLKGNFLENDK